MDGAENVQTLIRLRYKDDAKLMNEPIIYRVFSEA